MTTDTSSLSDYKLWKENNHDTIHGVAVILSSPPSPWQLAFYQHTETENPYDALLEQYSYARYMNAQELPLEGMDRVAWEVTVCNYTARALRWQLLAKILPAVIFLVIVLPWMPNLLAALVVVSLVAGIPFLTNDMVDRKFHDRQEDHLRQAFVPTLPVGWTLEYIRSPASPVGCIVLVPQKQSSDGVIV